MFFPRKGLLFSFREMAEGYMQPFVLTTLGQE